MEGGQSGPESRTVVEEAHSCNPGSLPRVGRTPSARPSWGKETPFPSPLTVAAPKTLNYLGMALPVGCQAQWLILYQYAAQSRSPAPAVRGGLGLCDFGQVTQPL